MNKVKIGYFTFKLDNTGKKTNYLPTSLKRIPKLEFFTHIDFSTQESIIREMEKKYELRIFRRWLSRSHHTRSFRRPWLDG